MHNDVDGKCGRSSTRYANHSGKCQCGDLWTRASEHKTSPNQKRNQASVSRGEGGRGEWQCFGAPLWAPLSVSSPADSAAETNSMVMVTCLFAGAKEHGAASKPSGWFDGVCVCVQRLRLSNSVVGRCTASDPFWGESRRRASQSCK